ncbi:MAG: right-handed parallel beta-helix repeat-containing protein [Sphingopyxis sp.]|uniref:calcium-binding protein n=1 Tax=Sphingopyxis sp. TaxID=1908224 RepID=UPI002AB8FFB0|nr:right-handed parallel beta-helix repeat-containing protein [Sphingopyxis sp.]MDZ3833690.1 right-handed parallel beta-helix repeat-containing protein [Sphingopyxis sp.]
MAIKLVNTSEALLAALKTAKEGDIIKLAPGTYDHLVIRSLDFPNVTITSADSNNRAVFSDLMIKYASGLNFSGIDMVASASSANNVFQVFGSKNISFDHITVSGPDNLGSGNEKSAFMIRSSSDVTVSNSEFHHLWHGINMLDNSDVTIVGNNFHDIRTDGVRGGGNSDLIISNNIFTDFRPNTGDHPDAIQLWSTNAAEPGRNITISDNLVVRGDGSPVQGIFIRDTFGQMPFENVAITGNLVMGGMYQGIALKGVDGAVIIGNQVVAYDDQLSWILADSASNVNLADNIASKFLINGVSLAPNGNKLAAPTSVGEVSALQQWLTGHNDFVKQWGSSDTVWLKTGLKEPALAAFPPPPPYILVSGTDGNDRLQVSVYGDSRLEGGAGNDTLTGGGQKSQLAGGDGDDIYFVKTANDVVIEEVNGGSDSVYASIDYTLPANVETLRLLGEGLTGTGNDLDNRMVGTTGTDRFYGMDGNDKIQGLGGDDWMWGGNGDDNLSGDDGDDHLFGEAGNDTLLGGNGNDFLWGGDGNDILEGGAGSDVMTGGAGADEFRFRSDHISADAVDVITDFQRGVDVIGLRAIDANINTRADDAFKFVGTAAFSGKAGELRYEVSNGTAHVYGDVNGDGIADFTIVLNGVQTLGAEDFYL